jgi:signal transduction histidine kinase
MKYTNLAQFIDSERATIVKQWEKFARTLLPAAEGMTARGLRDHANEILTAIIRDSRSTQTSDEQTDKAKGLGEAHKMEEVAQIHAKLRFENGFDISQLLAEYRALRGTVIHLWEQENKGQDSNGVTRFNESIDEAVSEAVIWFVQAEATSRSRFIGILSHDLRNPLAAIIMGLEALIGLNATTNLNAGIAARLLMSAQRMNDIIEDLLDLTRSQLGGQIAIDCAPMDMAQVCQQVLAEMSGLRPEDELRFTVVGDVRGEWDYARISQVLSNLIANAIRYGAPNTPITVAAIDKGSSVEVTVHNVGSTIAAPDLKSIFEPMVRLHKSDRRSAGLGLGLYIALQIALAHQGKIDVTSTEEDGTTFILYLPRPAPGR